MCIFPYKIVEVLEPIFHRILPSHFRKENNELCRRQITWARSYWKWGRSKAEVVAPISSNTSFPLQMLSRSNPTGFTNMIVHYSTLQDRMWRSWLPLLHPEKMRNSDEGCHQVAAEMEEPEVEAKSVTPACDDRCSLLGGCYWQHH